MSSSERSWRERLRIFLIERVFTLYCGMPLGVWLRLLWRHGFAVDYPYRPRAALVTATSLLTLVLRVYEQRKYGPKLAKVEIEEPPLFVLGHWRSGTTHLYNLLTVDSRFAYPNTAQVSNPHTFLSAEREIKVLGVLLPGTRMFDNVSLGAEAPQEDELALCTATALSPYMSWVFPRWRDYYERYLTFEEVPEEDLARWRAELLQFLKKLTLRYDRPLIIKSPPGTCRIRLLLEMFPEARFVHVHRNPYAVFRSSRRFAEWMNRATGLQRRDPEGEDLRIIERYRRMYEVFFEERGLIPDGQFHEVGYEELVRDPVGTVRSIYEKLGICGFEAVEEPLRCYADSVAHYQKNEHPQIPYPLRRQIARAWRRSFEEWGYDREQEEEKELADSPNSV